MATPTTVQHPWFCFDVDRETLLAITKRMQAGTLPIPLPVIIDPLAAPYPARPCDPEDVDPIPCVAAPGGGTSYPLVNILAFLIIGNQCCLHVCFAVGLPADLPDALEEQQQAMRDILEDLGITYHEGIVIQVIAPVEPLFAYVNALEAACIRYTEAVMGVAGDFYFAVPECKVTLAMEVLADPLLKALPYEDSIVQGSNCNPIQLGCPIRRPIPEGCETGSVPYSYNKPPVGDCPQNIDPCGPPAPVKKSKPCNPCAAAAPFSPMSPMSASSDDADAESAASARARKARRAGARNSAFFAAKSAKKASAFPDTESIFQKNEVTRD